MHIIALCISLIPYGFCLVLNKGHLYGSVHGKILFSWKCLCFASFMNNSVAEYRILKWIIFPQFLENTFYKFLEDIFSLLSAYFVADEKSVNLIMLSLLVISLFSICFSYFPLSFQRVQYSVMIAVVRFRSIRDPYLPSVVNVFRLLFSLPSSVFSFYW